MTTAKPIKDAYVIQSHETLPDGVRVLILPLDDGFGTYQSLRQALSYSGREYGKTGWNSDRLLAYYRDDAPIAKKGR